MFLVGGRRVLPTTGPFADVWCEVDVIASGPVRQMVAAKVRTFIEAEDGSEAEMVAMVSLYETVETMGRWVWNLGDAKGPIPSTAGGLYRVPVPLIAYLLGLWLDTFTAEVAL